MEKTQAFYGMYRHALWKTFRLSKTAEVRPEGRAARKTFLQLLYPARKALSSGKILAGGK